MNTMQMQLPKLTQLNKWLIIITGALFLIESILAQTGTISLVSLFAITSEGLSRFQFYTLLTYPFISKGLMETLFNLLIYWFIGSPLEQEFGTKKYLILLLLSTIVPAISFTFALPFFSNSSAILAGPSVLALSMLVSFAVMFPRTPFLFMLIIPIEARYFCMILIGIEFYLSIFSSAGLISSVTNLIAMATGYLFMKTIFPMQMSRSWGGGAKRRSTKSSHLRVVKGDEESKPKYWQ